MFTSDLEYFALLSSVGRIGTLMVSVVSRRRRLPSHLLRLLGSSSGASRSLPLADHNPSGNLTSAPGPLRQWQPVGAPSSRLGSAFVWVM